MQKLVRVKLSVEEYVREQFHRRMRPPSQCPNCGRFHRLWALGYYGRYTTGALGKAIAILVRRFRCTYCKVTVSCLPLLRPAVPAGQPHHAGGVPEGTASTA